MLNKFFGYSMKLLKPEHLILIPISHETLIYFCFNVAGCFCSRGSNLILYDLIAAEPNTPTRLDRIGFT